jgi:hypothetical protein
VGSGLGRWQIMDASANIHTGSSDWNRIFKVVSPPPKERIQFLRKGRVIQVGDFGWANPRWPKDKEGLIHLTGYDEKYLNIWYADFEAVEVTYIGQKPNPSLVVNPFPVKSAIPTPGSK